MYLPKHCDVASSENLWILVPSISDIHTSERIFLILMFCCSLKTVEDFGIRRCTDQLELQTFPSERYCSHTQACTLINKRKVTFSLYYYHYSLLSHYVVRHNATEEIGKRDVCKVITHANLKHKRGETILTSVYLKHRRGGKRRPQQSPSS